MQNTITTVSYDELITKSSINVKGTKYVILHEFNLLINKRGNLLKYTKEGKITEKSVYTSVSGYEYITFRGTVYFVHRLVALAYGLIDKYEYTEDTEIDHINDVRDDNRVCNLQVLTKQENLAKRKKTNNVVIVLSNEDNNEVYRFNSKTECAQWLIDNGKSKGTLQHTKEVLSRKSSSHYGYDYRYTKASELNKLNEEYNEVK